MKIYIALIKKGTLFIVGFILVVYLLQAIILFAIRSIEVGEFGVLNRVNGGDINAEVLISGSSRALKAINPQVISFYTGLSCYNISSDGSDLGVQIPKLKWYLNRNQKPKYLIQDLSQFGGGISDIIYEPYKYLAYFNDDSLFTGLLKIDKTMWQHKYIYPTNLIYFNFDFYVKLMQEMYHSVKKSDFLINGFYPDNSAWSGNKELFKEEYPNGIISTITDEYRNYMDELVRICNANNITLIMTVLPNFISQSDMNTEGDDVIAYYQSLEDRREVFLFNYANGPISREESNFYNFTHLNMTGATKLSELIAKDLLALL